MTLNRGRRLCSLSIVLYGLLALPALADRQSVINPHIDLRIEKVVMLMRHGASSGLAREQIARHSRREWPDFGVADDQLTAHGRAALMLWGQYHRRLLAKRRLLPAYGPLTTRQVSVLSHSTQKARDSATAFLEGLSPATSWPVPDTDSRLIFAPPLAGLRGANAAVVSETVVNALAMPLREAQKFYRFAPEWLERTLGIPDRLLSSMPWHLHLESDALHIAPLQLIDDMVETIRMQYAANLPIDQVAFGQVGDQKAMSRMLSLRALHNDAVRYPRFLAIKQGAPLFAMLHHAIDDAPMDQTSDAPVSLHVGSDQNFAAMRAILGFNWQMPEHARNDVNPGAMMLFERVRQQSSGAVFVRISYMSPNLDQIRHLSPYGDGSPPYLTTFAPPKAWHSTSNLIPMQCFASLAEAIAREATADTPTSTPVSNEICFPE